MDGLYVTSIVFGILAVLVCFFIFLHRSRDLTLMFRLLFDIFSALSITFAYLYSKEVVLFAGLGTNIVGIGADILFYFRKRYKWADHIFWLFLILSLYGLSLIFTYRSPISLLPIFGSFINTTALYLMNHKVTKWMTFCGQIFFITYYSLLLVGSDMLTLLNLLCSSVMMVSVIIGLFMIYFKKDQKTT